MTHVYQAERWSQYMTRWHDPHRRLEPIEREIEVIDGAEEIL